MYSQPFNIPTIFVCSCWFVSLSRDSIQFVRSLPPLFGPSAKSSPLVQNLPLLHLGARGGVELGEALAQAGLRRHGLGHAPADAARLAAREGLGGEVVDAGVEAAVDEGAEGLGA